MRPRFTGTNADKTRSGGRFLFCNLARKGFTSPSLLGSSALSSLLWQARPGGNRRTKMYKCCLFLFKV